MLTGLFINELYPLIGIAQPLSTTSLLITQTTIVMMGAIVSYLTKGKIQQPIIDTRTLLTLIPSLSIIILGTFGIFTLNATKDSSILLILIISASLLFLLSVLFKKLISPKFYPLILFIICISILFFVHSDTALVTNYIIGVGDQWIEYQAFRLTEMRYYWNSTMAPSPYSHVLFPTYSMISVTILPTIFSQILALDESWTFKILYPFLVSFMALGTFKLYRTQTNSKIAFLATFFFVTISSGKGWGSAKQMVAQLFYVLLFILLFDKKIPTLKKKILFIVLSFALVISHYALSYIFIFIMSFFFLFLVIKGYTKGDLLFMDKTKALLSLFMIYLTITFSWAIYVNASESFNLLLESINTVKSHIHEFFEPQSRGTALQGLGVVPAPTILHQISTFLFILTELFIVIGLLKLLTEKKESTFDQNYVIISALNLAIIAINLLLPKIADTFLMSRFYQTTLIILAPLGILGGQTLIEHIPKINIRKFSMSILTLMIIIPLFLFQTGFIYEVAGIRNESLPLDMHRWDVFKVHGSIVETEETLGAAWLSKYTCTSNTFIHSDIVSKFHVLTAYCAIERGRVLLLTDKTKPTLKGKEFVYLGFLSVINKTIETYLVDVGYHRLNVSKLSGIFESIDKVYSNGECEIYGGLGATS